MCAVDVTTDDDAETNDTVRRRRAIPKPLNQVTNGVHDGLYVPAFEVTALGSQYGPLEITGLPNDSVGKNVDTYYGMGTDAKLIHNGSLVFRASLVLKIATLDQQGKNEVDKWSGQPSPSFHLRRSYRVVSANEQRQRSCLRQCDETRRWINLRLELFQLNYLLGEAASHRAIYRQLNMSVVGVRRGTKGGN